MPTASYGNYAGGRRACNALRKRGIAIDVPAAGFLKEGTHRVKVEKAIECDGFNEITFVSERGHDTHKQRAYPRDSAFRDRYLHAGDVCTVVLEWEPGCYRVERVAEGYTAIVDGEVVGGPYSSMAALDKHAKESKVKRAYLRVVNITMG